MTDTDTLAHIEAVLAAKADDHDATSRWLFLIHDTYPEALAVVRDVVADHDEDIRTAYGEHDMPLETCCMDACRSAAAFLAAARDATEAGS